MMTVMVQDPVAPGSTPEAALAQLVDCIGQDRFGPALAHFLHGLCGADHFAAFRMGAASCAKWRPAACSPSTRRATVSRATSVKGCGRPIRR